jgi:hypothetical protein
MGNRQAVFADADFIADRAAIADLLAAWGHRDAGRWDELLALFTPDAHLELSWFSGPAAEFVSRSRAMGEGPFRSKHFMGTPRVEIEGTRAYTETDAMVIVDQVALGLGAIVQGRFVDQLSRSEGQWRLAHRTAVYDSSTFTYPYGFVEIDQAVVRRFPREYAPLSYLLQVSGFEVGSNPTRGSESEASILREAEAWLGRPDASTPH